MRLQAPQGLIATALLAQTLVALRRKIGRVRTKNSNPDGFSSTRDESEINGGEIVLEYKDNV